MCISERSFRFEISENPVSRGWVAESDGRIAAIGQLQAHTADETLDASGLMVAPGFIDVHTHDDLSLLSQGDMSCKVSQGVTTVVVGNCGISAAPLRNGQDLPMPLTELLGDDWRASIAEQILAIEGYQL